MKEKEYSISDVRAYYVTIIHTQADLIIKNERRIADLERQLKNFQGEGIDVKWLSWANWVASDLRANRIYAYKEKPAREVKTWNTPASDEMALISSEEAFALCGRFPSWSDDEPTPVINK